MHSSRSTETSVAVSRAKLWGKSIGVHMYRVVQAFACAAAAMVRWILWWCWSRLRACVMGTRGREDRQQMVHVHLGQRI